MGDRFDSGDIAALGLGDVCVAYIMHEAVDRDGSLCGT